jgi:serine/threonine protein kinase
MRPWDGGFAQGEMPDGTEMAVRRLPLNSRQGKREFVKGVKNMSEAQHRNVVRLIGCSYTNSRLLVYEYLPNGNLAQILFGTHHSPP